ncbi:MAG TPA: glycoside hydrolase family 38 C-terminal domain-containing protein [Candidatus Baltobacteraceae bacterium]|nr:glycoside hydrolase family 38 C-terminal domain-containing protein [Candidatus Baltobacteraceae bacterium]
MARFPLHELRRDDALAYLTATLPPQTQPVSLSYRTRTGALLRVDGAAAGAFDREHHEVVLPAGAQPRELVLEVELSALPTNGLPSGPGIVWRYLNARSRERPRRELDVRASRDDNAVPGPPKHDDARDAVPCIGHSHLDVAWLWTYEQARRKAQRTFAIACDLLDRDPDFVFVQSQPQLYKFVEEDDPQLFERVRAHVAQGRWDTDVAAMWVESDCNVPSGESLLRQLLYGHEYCVRRFGKTPSIAWLPDTFGFANTLPQLLAHAGIPYFATTKLNWNDTTKFPYPQFVWSGPDGSSVVCALIRSYDGGAYPWRINTARSRREPLVLGYGDGGGGVTAKMLDQVRALGSWIHPRAWFEALAHKRETLPAYAGELYLEYHRGVYTTHHDVKFHNALLERALIEAEELLAWCVAVHAPRAAVEQFAQRLHDCWETLLRNQFHDVLPGTSITPVYEDALSEYAHAEELAASVLSSAQSMLPRASAPIVQSSLVGPKEDEGAFVFDNGLLQARVTTAGAIVEMRLPGGRSVCSQGNVLALYRDKPRAWEAWNLDRGYEQRMRRATPRAARIENDALLVDFLLGSSPATMRVTLHSGEPFLRVDLDVDWRERRTLLRVENWLPVVTDRVTYGSPHGVLTRSALAQTPEDRAKFEVPGQRFALARDDANTGLAIFALDTYGWSARVLAAGGVRIGHSLLRGTTWPDERADIGAAHFSYAFAPFAGVGVGALELAWQQFAHEARVRLFTCEDPAVIVVACKPAHDGDGVIVRVRECDGAARSIALRCAARMTHAAATDALERPVEREVRIEQEHLRFDLRPYELRSLRVRFSHE